MGRDAQVSQGNVWREARLRAAENDETLYSRERVAEQLGIGIDAVRRIETNANKIMPVDTAVLMADLYKAPELRNHYCLYECPIGRDRPISTNVVGIDRVTVKLLKTLNTDDLDWLKDKLLDIAEDGVISDDELSDMQKILEYFNKLEKTASELKIIAEKAIKGAKTV